MRVNEIEHGTFTQLIFSCSGGMSQVCLYFYKQLALKLPKKRNICVSEAVCFIPTNMNISFVKSLVLCIRDSRTVEYYENSIADAEIVLTNDI